MTPEMIERARQNTLKQPHGNVEFHLATIDRLPLPADSVDCVISNCVLNLVPDKPAAFREIFRVLKPGGRLAVSDIALKKPLPDELTHSVMAYIGCIAGAILMREYEQGLREAGFASVQVVDTHKDLNAYAQVESQSACCSPAMKADGGLPIIPACADEPSSDFHKDLAAILDRYDVNDYAASVQAYAVKSR
jgi:SAM-dependent methyltransferase